MSDGWCRECPHVSAWVIWCFSNTPLHRRRGGGDRLTTCLQLHTHANVDAHSRHAGSGLLYSCLALTFSHIHLDFFFFVAVSFLSVFYWFGGVWGHSLTVDSCKYPSEDVIFLVYGRGRAEERVHRPWSEHPATVKIPTEEVFTVDPLCQLKLFQLWGFFQNHRWRTKVINIRYDIISN